LNHTQTSKHKIIAWNDGPVHKYVTRTIHYQGAGDQTPDDEVETVDLSRTATFDGHGGFTWTAWVADGSFKRVETPQIIGYTADKNVVESYTPTATDSDFTVTVTYTPNTNPDIPGETPDIPKKPDNHPKDDKPKKPDQPVKKPTKSVAKKQNNQKLIKKQATMSPRTRKTAPNTNSVRKHAQASLPQTGSHSGLASTIFGSLAILLGLSAFLYRDKKKRN
jgi:LPXTG-motif cell wall-anchored protein